MTGAMDLLRRLGSGVRPTGAASAPGGANASGASVDAAALGFGHLVAEARRGVVRTGRKVTAPASLDHEVEREVLAWLGAALDDAEAAGVNTLAAVVGDRLYQLDVAGRRIEASQLVDAGGVWSGTAALAVLPLDAKPCIGGGPRIGPKAEQDDGGEQADEQAAAAACRAQRVRESAERWSKRALPLLFANSGDVGTRNAEALGGLGRSSANRSLADALARHPDR